MEQIADTPERALELLMKGNARFVAGELASRTQNLVARRHETAPHQEPFACVVACSDSREPVELIFDQTIGDLFVVRVAGNIMTPEVVGSIEFAPVLLGTKLVMILGHSSCGAVTAAVKGEPVPGKIGTLLGPIQPAVKTAKGDIDTAVKENAKLQARLLLEQSPLLADLVRRGKLKIVAGRYDLATGQVSVLPDDTAQKA